MSRISTDLYVEVTDADGTRHKLNANEPIAGNRPLGLSFSTSLGNGFAQAGFSLARDTNLTYRDIALVNDVDITGADGSTAYEGRIEGTPRDLSETHRISVTLAGHMAHAKDAKFRMPYVDRALSEWHGMSAQRRAALLTANFMPLSDGSQNTDPATALGNITTSISGAWASPYLPLSASWYDAGPGNTIGKIGYGWKITGPINSADANWAWEVLVASDANATAVEATANLRAAGPSTGQTFDPAAAYRYAALQLRYGAAGGADGAEYGIAWDKLAVYGDHGLTLHEGETGEPPGVYASDVIRHIVSNYCPRLNADGVLDTSYVIQHLAFKDRTHPFDAFLEVNKYHLWHLGVWDNRTLHFRPYDLTDYDWEVRKDDEGTTFSDQGISTENLYNGLNVLYTDILTGTAMELSAEDYPELRDPSVSNPWNRHGRPHYDDLPLSTPTTAASALQIGRVVLAEKMRTKAPGSIRLTGYVGDRSGNLQPVWKVRAGDTILVTDDIYDEPRLITETQYDADSHTLALTVDQPSSALDAIMDRTNNALTARGLA